MQADVAPEPVRVHVPVNVPAPVVAKLTVPVGVVAPVLLVSVTVALHDDAVLT